MCHEHLCVRYISHFANKKFQTESFEILIRKMRTFTCAWENMVKKNVNQFFLDNYICMLILDKTSQDNLC